MHGLIGTENAETLLERMRAGDREAAAEFMERMGPRLKRRLGSKLGPVMRRVLDSQEVLSTVVRRLDRFVLSRRLRATTAGELWTFLCVVADHAVIEKGRRHRSARTGGPAWMAGDLRAAHDRDGYSPADSGLDLARTLQNLDDPVDRQILALWLAGQRLAHMGAAVGLAPTAVRKRWQAIRQRLRAEMLAEEGG
jgi:DNA-directed RNA polymerase specialized sigma24 family protein